MEIQIPDWIRDRAEENQAPPGIALRVEIAWAEIAYGLPFPEEDPSTEDQSTERPNDPNPGFIRVIDPSRFIGNTELDD